MDRMASVTRLISESDHQSGPSAKSWKGCSPRVEKAGAAEDAEPTGGGGSRRAGTVGPAEVKVKPSASRCEYAP